MKKRTIIAVCVLLCAVMTAVSFAACQSDDTTYYGKTYTITGAGLAVDWNEKIWADPMEDGMIQEYFSTRELLEKYWDNLDWEKIGKDDAPQNVDELISVLEKNIVPEFYKEMKGVKIEVGTKDNLTIKVSYPEDKGFGKELTIDNISEIKNQEGKHLTYIYSIAMEEGNYEFTGYIDSVTNIDGKESLRFGIPWKIVSEDFVESNPSSYGVIPLKGVEKDGGTYVYNINYMVNPEVEITVK